MSTQFILHRVNTISQLQALPALQASAWAQSWGCEIDLRAKPSAPPENAIYMQHDPFAAGEAFAPWLAAYAAQKQRGALILNTKEDGLETALLQMLESHKIQNFFFLDTALPTLIKHTTQGVRNFALRISQYEHPSGFSELISFVDWLWVDCFHKQPLDPSGIAELPVANKVLVSPELQGGSSSDFLQFKALAKVCTHICTKFPEQWQQTLQEES